MIEFGMLNISSIDIVKENNQAYVIWDGFPVSKGHCLIIPKRVVKSFFDLKIDEKKMMLELVDEMRLELIDLYQPDGFNVGFNDGEAAGQTIMHCHIHLIPRYDGDVENPRGGVRGVIPSKQSY